MFFEDPIAAISEMLRVSSPRGIVGVAVWGALESNPGYAAMEQLVKRLFGTHAADAVRMPFRLGDPNALTKVLSDAGVSGAEIAQIDVTASFPSIADWVYTEIKGWTLANDLDDDQFDLLKREADRELSQFTEDDGKVAFESPVLFARTTKVD